MRLLVSPVSESGCSSAHASTGLKYLKAPAQLSALTADTRLYSLRSGRGEAGAGRWWGKKDVEIWTVVWDSGGGGGGRKTVDGKI